eukprot:scaffold116329_cov20-Tisochrysis_lutea.AAC.2
MMFITPQPCVSRLTHLSHARHDVIQPACALPAGGALPAALVLVEVRQAHDGVNHIGLLVLRIRKVGSGQAAL